MIACSVLSFWADGVWEITVLRFVLGVSVAADYPIATSLLAEWLPTRHRGRLLGKQIVAWYASSVPAYLVGYLFLQLGGNGSWRWMLASSTLLCAFFLVVRRGSPESPRRLAAHGRVGGTVMDTLGTGMISLVFLAGCYPALRLIDTVGRRPTIVWSFALMIVPLALLGLWPTASALIAVTVLCAYAFLCGGPNVLDWTYPNELFPTEIRATAVGVATSVSRVGAAVGTYLLPLSLRDLGAGPTMLIAAGVTAVGFAVCVLWAEETKDVGLGQEFTRRNTVERPIKSVGQYAE